ncbi:MAG: DMT family transporter [Alphaproteobacteria bacterium]|nr:DMT family transporter [Alphaproteobacteria bacterium]MDA8003345.1 DMT family transporter [Alphaproteobacteria bacterium]MDA8005321.1 DMT family transporter [Alphaproteobacteria bacterium]MDA8012730.1 DMT family transporter [Alphaproteobacteria bacterium]
MKPPGKSYAQKPVAGVAAMLGFCFVVALLDATAKYLVEQLPTLVVLWCRYAFQLVLYSLILVTIFRKHLRAVLRTRRLKLQILRSLILVVESGCIFAALSVLPLAETIAVSFIYPFLVALLAVPLLGEHIGKWRLFGILFGFIGVLLVIRPGGELFHPAVLFALASAFLFACYQVLTRRLSDADSPWTTLFYTALGGALAAGLPAMLVWETPDPRQIALLATIGALGLVAHGLLIIAFTYAAAALVANFGYTELIWATLLGWLFFSHLPDPVSLAGIIIIAGSGLIVLWRERRAVRAGDAPDTEP